MTNLDRNAILDREIAEIGDALRSLLVPNLDPRLDEALQTALSAVQERASAADLDRVTIAVGSAYITLRQAIELLGVRVSGVHEDMVGLHTDQERDAAISAAGIAALMVVNTAVRLNDLEARVTTIEERTEACSEGTIS